MHFPFNGRAHRHPSPAFTVLVCLSSLLFFSCASPGRRIDTRKSFTFELLTADKVVGKFSLNPGGEWQNDPTLPLLHGINSGIWTQGPENIVLRNGEQPIAVLEDCQISTLNRVARGPVEFNPDHDDPIRWHFVGRN